MASAITGTAVVNTILQRPAMADTPSVFMRRTRGNIQDALSRVGALLPRRKSLARSALLAAPVTRSSPQSTVHSPQSTVHSPQSTVRKPWSPQSAIGFHVRLTPGVTIAQRAVIEGPYVELREAVVAPPYPRGVRFLQNVCVPTLLRAVETHGAVADVITAYLQSPEGKRCPPESVRQVLARLYQEGVLTAVESD